MRNFSVNAEIRFRVDRELSDLIAMLKGHDFRLRMGWNERIISRQDNELRAQVQSKNRMTIEEALSVLKDIEEAEHYGIVEIKISEEDNPL